MGSVAANLVAAETQECICGYPEVVVSDVAVSLVAARSSRLEL